MLKFVVAAAVASLVLAAPVSASAAHHMTHHKHQKMMMYKGHRVPVFVMVNGKMEPVMVDDNANSANGQ